MASNALARMLVAALILAGLASSLPAIASAEGEFPARPSSSILVRSVPNRIPYTAAFFAATSTTFPEGTATIPFELLDGLLLFRCEAIGAGSDTVGVFVLDTGAGYLALDHELAASLGIADAGDSSNAVGLARDPLRRFVLGDQSMDMVQPVLTIDGAIIRRVTDRPVLGLLGSKLYADRAIQIDYVGRKARLIPVRSSDPPAAGTPTSQAAPAAGGSSLSPPEAVARSRRILGNALGSDALGVPFEMAGDGKILVHVRLGVSRFATSRPLTLILDTGATKTVLFRGALASLGIGVERWPSLCGLSVPTLFGAPSACLMRMPRVNLDAFAPEPDFVGAERSERGAESKSTTPAPTITRRVRPGVRAMLGPSAGSDVAPPAPQSASASTEAGPGGPRSTVLRADDLDAIVMESELQEVLSRVVGTPVHGLLGYTFLRHYRITIDYPQRVAWFEPASDPDPRPFEYSHPGIQLERDGSDLRVVAVAEGSPAARKKVAAGDTLVSVDARDVAGRDLAEVARWLEGEPGTRVTLVVGNSAGRRAVVLTRRRLL